MTSLRPLAFLINPVSGGGVGKEVFQELGEILDSFGMRREEWTAELTDPDRLTPQIDGMLSAAAKLVVVGGDGTMGLVLDRMRRLKPTAAIGLIPLGTGNDLGRALGIFRVYSAKGLIACLKRLLKAPTQAFDLWDVEGEATLVSYLSAGMDAAVLRSFDQARKQGRLHGGALGNKLYYVSAFFAHARDKLPAGAKARIEAADGTATTLDIGGRPAVLVANINSYAAGAHPFPENRVDDGHLEVAVFGALWQYALVAAGTRAAPRLARWMRGLLPKYRARRVVLELPPGTPVQLDGEDITEKSAKGHLTISYAARVHLLDLRRSFYALF